MTNDINPPLKYNSLFAPWKPPFKYNSFASHIEDSQGNRILDIRGWGYLTGRGGLGLKESAAADIQDSIGHRIANLMNNDALRIDND